MIVVVVVASAVGGKGGTEEEGDESCGVGLVDGNSMLLKPVEDGVGSIRMNTRFGNSGQRGKCPLVPLVLSSLSQTLRSISEKGQRQLSDPKTSRHVIPFP